MLRSIRVGGGSGKDKKREKKDGAMRAGVGKFSAGFGGLN